MLEILVALPHQIRQTRSSRVTTWIARTAQVHLSFRTHILAAIRLFTCQRARLIRTPISHPNFGQSSATDFTANVGGNFRYRRRVSPIGEADISVSFGGVNRCRRTFFRSVVQPFSARRGDAESRTDSPVQDRSNHYRLLGAAICSARMSPFVVAVQAPQPMTSEGR